MYRTHYTQEAKVVHLYGNVAVDSSGDVTLDTANSKGIASVSHDTTGEYTITFKSVWTALLACHVMELKSSAQDITFQVKAVNLASKTLTFMAKTGSSAADPTSCTLYMHVIVKHTST